MTGTALSTASRPWGVLHGLGGGPGDPELLTLKAVRLLGQVEAVFAASSTKNDFSHALEIARPHLKPDTPVTRLPFPMTADSAALKAAWEANAHAVAEVLATGKNAAFLTLGDPLLFSTFGYLARTLAALYPQARLAATPGVTSFQQAAATAVMPLAEAGEPLLVLPGVAGGEALKAALNAAPNVAVLKAYKNYKELKQVVAEGGCAETSAAFTRLGLEGEHWSRDLDSLGDSPHYLTLMLVKRKG
ncbi:MAG: precorrin-2 C(20)-methyltransferase [Desulfovibrio sp.]|nr:precorrin-2 C(20)-methyltransferase [Desulfovibrio sp.]